MSETDGNVGEDNTGLLGNGESKRCEEDRKRLNTFSVLLNRFQLFVFPA